MDTKRKHPVVLTVRECKEILRVHRPKIYDLINEGVIVGFKVGGDWRIKRDSVEALVGRIPEEFFDRAPPDLAEVA